MARHKKHQSIEDPDPALDISSLIDVCFLLLIYFIVTSTIAPREQDLGLQLPGVGMSTEQPKIAPMLINITETGTISATSGGEPQTLDSDPGVRELPLLNAQLELYVSGVSAAGEKPLVQIFASPEATQQRVIDVLNALAGAKINAVTFTDLIDSP